MQWRNNKHTDTTWIQMEWWGDATGNKWQRWLRASINNTFALTAPICRTRQSLLGKMHRLLGKILVICPEQSSLWPSERKQALVSQAGSSALSWWSGSGQHLKLLFTSLRCGPRSLCQRMIGLKYFCGGPEGWGPTYPASNPVNSCSKSSISVLPQIGAVLPNSIKGQCHNHPIGLPSSNSRVRLCTFLAVVLTHLEVDGWWLQATARLTCQSWILFPEK